MKEHYQAVVIGGGVVGTSVLFHLAKHGFKDVLLIERNVLTCGSTWHAAGGFHTLNGDPNVAKLQAYTIDLYKEIEELSGQSCGVHMTGGVMLAGTEARMDFIRQSHAKGRYLGMDTEIISASQAKDLMPLIDEKKFIGGLYDPLEGHLDPSGVTQAYAKSAKHYGAEIVEHNRVLETNPNPNGTWTVVTEKGTVTADHVVNAGGLWAREVGRLVGLELPILAMEHMYLLTDDMPEVAEINKSTGKEVLHVIDCEGELYLRQERGGMLMGTYEKAGVPWSPKETPWNFSHELLQEDLDRLAPSLEVGFEHFPAFENAGIRQVINGPFTFAPDGNPVIGPVRGLPNYWVACGVMAGFSQGGGVGVSLAEWIINGDPGFDVFAMDVARFGDWTSMAYTNAKVRENYSNRFRIIYPNEHRPAARPLKTTGLYNTMLANNAVMGCAYGLEVALWFAPEGMEPVEELTYKRSNAFEPVAAECKNVRENVGLMEISGFAKYHIVGADAEDWLKSILPVKMPKIGKMALAPMLKEDGKLIGDFTVARMDEDEFYIFGSGIAEEYHMRWFEQHLPDDLEVFIDALGHNLSGLSLAGPNARKVLQKLVDQDLATEEFPFLSIDQMHIGMFPALVGRITFTGDLGYEIWTEPHYVKGLFDVIMEAGADEGIKLFGLTALNSLRLEKSFGGWAREYRPIYGPLEAGMGRFVDYKRDNYIGAAAAAAEKTSGGTQRLVTFTVAAQDGDVLGDEPIWHNGEVVGWITSGGFAHYVGQSVAMGYMPKEFVGSDGQFEIEIRGRKHPATLQTGASLDPKAERMRG